MDLTVIKEFALTYPLQLVEISSILILLIYFVILNRRVTRLFKSSKGASLEDSVLRILNENDTLKNENKQIKDLLVKLMEQEKMNIKAVATVRFNPFSQSGHGKQSFATAMLNGKGDGFVISTLSVRGETHVFMKDVEGGIGDKNLSEEENTALEKAKEKLYNAKT